VQNYPKIPRKTIFQDKEIVGKKNNIKIIEFFHGLTCFFSE